MHIHNIRLGLATNSSSTHSIVILPPDAWRRARTTEYGDFGWDHWTASDRDSRENYFGYLTRHTLNRLFGDQPEVAAAVLDQLFPHRQNFANYLEHAGYGVDHQSILTLPLNWEGTAIHAGFFQEMHEFLLQPGVAILGGNDNGVTEHPLLAAGRQVTLPLPRDEYRGKPSLVARHDATQRYWTLFHRDNGAKLRFSFADVPPIMKSVTPELVDIKITDYCPFGCAYCYQSSTLRGQHAGLGAIQLLAASLAELQVFEVAIGGGEPTLHPQFVDILKTFRELHIVPNFTTRNLGWLRDPEKRAEIVRYMGAFAVSVNTGADVDALAEAVGEQATLGYDGWSKQVTVQYVVGAGGNLREVLERASAHRYRVTLLGFKRVGFGTDHTEVPENWIEIVKAFRVTTWVSLGVDTALVQELHQDIVRELKVNPVLMTSEEGKFSMYIDLVAGFMAPSSYCDERDRVHTGWLDRDLIRQEFAAW